MPSQLIVKSLETKEDEKDVYVEGYASASIKDLDGEIITEEALQQIAEQIVIPPYNKVFIAHAPLIKRDTDFEDEIPIGKVVEAEVKEVDGKQKVWIKILLNKAHPAFEIVYNSLKDGFLDAFSIGFIPLEKEGNKITKLQILEVSLVGVPSNPEALVEEVYAKMFGEKDEIATKGVVPRHLFRYGKDDSGSWSKPTLRDFTDKTWDELSDEEKRRIAGHFAWAPKNPPDRFTDLKLPHHDPKTHNVVWRGVVAAMAALFGARGGVDIPAEDRRKVYNHLAAHYREFGREPPEFKMLEELAAELKAILEEEADSKEVADEALKSLNQTPTNMEEVERIKQLETANSELATKVSELEAKIKELEEENAKLKEENKELSEEVKQYVEREKAAIIEKIKGISDEINEDELKEKDIAELKEMYLTLLETKVLKVKALPSKVKVGGEEEEEVSFKGVF